MPPPPGHDPRYEMLDVWRGVACLMVVLHHSGFAIVLGDSDSSWVRRAILDFVRLMDLGVPLFFVISGYCIAASMDSHRRRGASPWTFLGRRFKRIYPPYWAALLVFVATIWALDHAGLTWLHKGAHSLELKSPGQLGRAQWLGNVTLTEMWRVKVWGGMSTEVYTRVAWSLCFEEQFYFVCFLALLVAPRRLYGVIGGLTVAIVGFRVWAFDVGWLPNYRGMFLELWHEFAVGLLVYWRLVAAPSDRARRAVDAILAAVLVAGLIGLARPDWEVVGPIGKFRSTWVAAGFGLVLIALRGRDEAAGRLAWPGPLRACGRRCYSIYLIHLPACTIGNEWLYSLGIVSFWGRVLVMIPLVSLAAVGAGWAFFRLVESRFLNPPANRKPHARALAGERDPSPVGEVEEIASRP